MTKTVEAEPFHNTGPECPPGHTPMELTLSLGGILHIVAGGEDSGNHTTLGSFLIKSDRAVLKSVSWSLTVPPLYRLPHLSSSFPGIPDVKWQL